MELQGHANLMTAVQMQKVRPKKYRFPPDRIEKRFECVLLLKAWNPAVEEQCFDRSHRLGQTREVIITKVRMLDLGHTSDYFCLHRDALLVFFLLRSLPCPFLSLSCDFQAESDRQIML